MRRSPVPASEPTAAPRRRLRAGSRCPSCSAGRLLAILYGLPTAEHAAEVDAGRIPIQLGGCVIGPMSPELVCERCLSEFYRDGTSLDDG